VKTRGGVACGVNSDHPGFSQPNEKGEWTGLDADYCRAIAAAVFGDATKVRFVPLTAKERFVALQTGEVGILARNTTWTMSRDSMFALGVKSAKELNGATICIQAGTTTELNIAGYFKSDHMDYKAVLFDKYDEAAQAYFSGHCDVYTTDQTVLYSIRAQQSKPDDHSVLPEIISKEPLSPYVRWGDGQWLKIARRGQD